jgi:excisionase family DNA binding protein
MEERIYTVAEVADQLKVTPKTVRGWIADKELVAIRVGREWRIRAQDLQAYIQAHLSRSMTEATRD